MCYINELNEMVLLKEPKSWKEIQRIGDAAIRDRWNAAMRAMLSYRGLRMPMYTGWWTVRVAYGAYLWFGCSKSNSRRLVKR